MANPLSHPHGEGVHITISPMALKAMMGSTGEGGGAMSESRGETPSMGSGGGSGEVWKGDSGMDDPSVKANLQGSSGRGETGGSLLTRGLPPGNSFSPSGGGDSPKPRPRSLLGGG
jgi:hypothetical protein